MKKRFEIFMLFLLIVTAAAEASGIGEDSSGLSEGLDLYNQRQLEDSAAKFREAAASADPEISAAGHYNAGTVTAEIAGKTDDPSRKKQLLEQAWEELKRASDSAALPRSQRKAAGRNLEVVRRMIDELPREQQEQKEQQDQNQQNDRVGQQGSRQPNEQGRQDGSSGDQQQKTGDPGNLLEQQKDLSSRTEEGGKTSELAEEQRQLQKASEDAGLDDAAASQAMAAEALDRGDRDDASAYQKNAERALAEAGNEQESNEAEQILNREAEQNEYRDRLDRKGGIADVDRNW